MHPVTQKNGSKKQHNRRGSLPNLNVANHHKLASVDFGSPLRSPFPPPLLPEKGSIAIQLGGDSHTVINTNKTILKNLSYIFTWYFFSTCLSLYNKNLMGRDRFNFNYPLLASAIHAMLHSIITACIMWFGGTQNGLANKKAMSLKDYFYKVVSNEQ
jgi:hypothetical protein